MNAGRDVERLIAGWLVEEAADRAPDRVLEATRRSIDRTRQRRFVAAWREPMYLSPLKITAAAAVVAVALLGAAYFGRMTAPAGVGAPPAAPTTAPASSGVDTSFVAYRNARDAICIRYVSEADPMKAAFDEGVYDDELTAAERAPKIDAMTRFVGLYDRLIGDLANLDAPPAIAGDHAANVARFEDLRNLIDQIVTALRAGNIDGAQGIDFATEPVAGGIEAFERANVLAHCP